MKFVASDDPIQVIYEKARSEALKNFEPASLATERIRRYGVAGLLPGTQEDFAFVCYTHIVPRPAWSGKKDFHLEALNRAYEFLLRPATESASGDADGRGPTEMVEMACNEEDLLPLAPDGELQDLVLKESERIEMIFLGGATGGKQPWSLTARETQRMPSPDQPSAFAIKQ